MVANSKIYPFKFTPGTKRDNTQFDGNNYSDSKWCRWYRQKPKKIGGYLSTFSQFSNIVRGEPYLFAKNLYNYVYGGSAGNLEMVVINNSGGGGAYYDRTPAGFVSNPLNEWKMDAIYDSAGTQMDVIAMATQTVMDISDSTNNKIYYGDVTGTAALTQLGTITVSGGVCTLDPFLFVYGNDGYIAWSDKNAIANIGGAGGGQAGEARICASKVVKGISLRGGTSAAPSGLFFSLDTIQRVSFVGGSTIFSNDTVAVETSLLSTNAVVDYDGVIYFITATRFMSYNGVVQEVQNPTHLDWFFENYNQLYSQKIFAIKKPRYGEIWYCFPFGQATECTHALIYNVREGYWYDTILPEGGRSAGISQKTTFKNPLMFGIEPTSSSKYRLWMHETGVDKVVDGQALAIESYFETPTITLVDEGPLEFFWQGDDHWVKLIRLEPDFILTGALTISVKGKPFAMAPDGMTTYYNYDGITSFKVDSKKQYRQMRINFNSNVQGGNYYMGKTLMELAPGDKRATSGVGN